MLVKKGMSPIHMLGRISEMNLFVQNTHERCRKENIGRQCGLRKVVSMLQNQGQVLHRLEYSFNSVSQATFF